MLGEDKVLIAEFLGSRVGQVLTNGRQSVFAHHLSLVTAFAGLGFVVVVMIARAESLTEQRSADWPLRRSFLEC